MSDHPISRPWQLESITLGEYIAFPKLAARIVRQERCDYAIAVQLVLQGRTVSETERKWLEDKTKQHVLLSYFEGDNAEN